MEIRPFVKWLLTRGQKQQKKHNAVTSKSGSGQLLLRWSLTKGSNYRALTGKKLTSVLDRCCGRLSEVVAHVGWTVLVSNKSYCT